MFIFVCRTAGCPCSLAGETPLPADVGGATSLPLAWFVKGPGISIRFYSVSFGFIQRDTSFSADTVRFRKTCTTPHPFVQQTYKFCTTLVPERPRKLVN